MADPSPGGAPPRIASWAAEVQRRTGGAVQIEFKENWRLGDANFEAGAIADVQAGKVDITTVGARVFDTVGVNSIQALGAPMLIDSYDLEAAVFKAGIPQ